MARYKHYNYQQTKMLPVNFEEQILPGTFEHCVNYLVDHELDLQLFNSRYKNDRTGAPAYDPAILLKIVLVAYSRGTTSSRRIERLCRENIIFMALSADSQPHFTTIADFISRMEEVIQPIFLQLLMTCDQAGLIGQDMFAIDGCKLPSNASKEWSGTHADLQKKQRKLNTAVRRMLKKHREEDAENTADESIRQKELQQIETLRGASKKVKQFLDTEEERVGSRGKPNKSNITDNHSAKMKTSHGVIQGYNGVAAADSKHQIVIAAEAFGQGPEHDLLEPLVEQVKENLGEAYIQNSALTADAGFHNKNNIAYCNEENVDAYIADGNFRKRDPRFVDRERFKPTEKKKKFYQSGDFHFDIEANTCRCPAGKEMWKGGNRQIEGNLYITFQGYLKNCRTCPLQKQCMRKPPGKSGRQVSFKLGEIPNRPPNLTNQMREKIDSNQGRHIYSDRLGAIEPVFGNINTTKGLDWFSLRGKSKVNAQWLMFCMVHNIEKLQRYGPME